MQRETSMHVWQMHALEGITFKSAEFTEIFLEFLCVLCG